MGVEDVLLFGRLVLFIDIIFLLLFMFFIWLWFIFVILCFIFFIFIFFMVNRGWGLRGGMVVFNFFFVVSVF